MNSKYLRVGLIGAGFMGRIHADIINSLDQVKIMAILDKNVDSAQEIESLTGCATYTDIDTFFQDNIFDVIDICAPTWLHEELIYAALDHGCHVFCEKPLTLTTESAESIRRKAKLSNRQIMIGQVLRFWPHYVKIKEIIESGKLGDIQSIHAYRINQSPQWANWFLYPDLGGGALFDLHIHDIDFIYSLFGFPDKVYSCGNKGLYGAWDSVTSILSWENLHAVVEADWTYPDGFPFQFGIRIKGKEYALQYQFTVSGNVESKQAAKESLTLISKNQLKEIDCSMMEEAYTAELNYYYNCIKRNFEIEKASISDAVEVLRIIEMEQYCLESGGLEICSEKV